VNIGVEKDVKIGVEKEKKFHSFRAKMSNTKIADTRAEAVCRVGGRKKKCTIMAAQYSIGYCVR
jgi:hypothetical protein